MLENIQKHFIPQIRTEFKEKFEKNASANPQKVTGVFAPWKTREYFFLFLEKIVICQKKAGLLAMMFFNLQKNNVVASREITEAQFVFCSWLGGLLLCWE